MKNGSAFAPKKKKMERKVKTSYSPWLCQTKLTDLSGVLWIKYVGRICKACKNK